MTRQTVARFIAGPAGRFRALDPGRRVVEEIEFETTAPALLGRMTVTTTLEPGPGGTTVTLDFDALPPGVDPALNEAGTRMSLEKLARLAEAGEAANNPRTIL